MNKNFSILLFTGLLCISGCNAKSVEMQPNSEIKVEPCGFDYDIDNYYCKTDKLNLYKNSIGKTTDFDKDYTIIKINDGKYFRLVALNQRKLKVYPLNYQISQKNAQFEHSNNNDSLCITGDFYGYQNAYNNSKICFKIIDSAFVKTSIYENASRDNKINDYNLKKIILPNSSDYISECLKNNSQNKCNKLSSAENHVYMLNDIQKISPEISGILNSQKIKNLNLDGFKFLPNIGSSQYVIGEKYQDTDGGSNTLFYLLKIKPNLDVKSIGSSYSIDKQLNLSYKDVSGNKKNIKLN